MKSRPTVSKVSRSEFGWPRGAVRIVGGQWKRTLLPVVDVPGLRPTPDRVRETLFNWLNHLFGGSVAGCSVLDLFAGTGALGLEAASRGAGPVVLVERDAVAFEALGAIIGRLNASQVDVRRGDAMTVARQYVETGAHFNVVFLDPPFGEGWLAKLLPLALDLCDASGVIYAESESRLGPPILAEHKLELVRAGKAGDVFYHLLQRAKDA